MTPRIGTANRTKFLQLEAARGIASLVVLVHHVILGFTPGLKAAASDGGALYTPFYVLMNGTAAVAFFFVLSGFVLTQRFYLCVNAADLAQAVLKRLPRLMLPAGLTILAGFVVFYYLTPHYLAAANLTGSPWLHSFAYGGPMFPLHANLADALRQWLLVFVTFDHSYYNSNLWTMALEFYGSLLVFALAGITGLVGVKRPWQVGVMHCAAIWVVSAFGQPWLVSFVCGSGLAYVYSLRPDLFDLGRGLSVALAAVAFACFMTEHHDALVVGGILMVILLLAPNRASRALAGAWGVWLGVLSFPLYLVHMLVIMSVTSAVYVAANIAGTVPTLALTLTITLAASMLSALPLIWVEARWLPALNRATKVLVARFIR